MSAALQRLSLTLLGLCLWSGCGGSQAHLIDREPTWSRSSDQESLEVLRHIKGSLWGVAQGQLLAWRMDSERLYRASNALPSGLTVYDLWVEEADPKRLNQVRRRSYEAYIKRLKEAPPQGVKRATSPQSDSLIELEEIEIEGEGEVSEGEELDLDLSDIVIDTTSAPSPVAAQVTLPPPPAEVKWRFRVYVASSGGLLRREVWLDERWRDLLGDQTWRLIQ